VLHPLNKVRLTSLRLSPQPWRLPAPPVRLQRKRRNSLLLQVHGDTPNSTRSRAASMHTISMTETFGSSFGAGACWFGPTWSSHLFCDSQPFKLFRTYLVLARVFKIRLTTFSKPVFILSAAYPTAFTWVATAIRAIFVWNIVTALLPLFRRWNTDDIVDIALTPEQRLAMGLDPNKSTPVVPGSTYVSPNYVTPPRYQKSTPRSSLSNQGDKSPLSGTGSPRGLGQSTSQSPFSPSSGSPLFHRALGGSTGRRLSYDRQSPLASSLFSDSTSSNTPGTPTPVVGRASVSLNNKWLYEKGRSSSRSGLYS